MQQDHKKLIESWFGKHDNCHVIHNAADIELIRNSMHDNIIEPIRSKIIPGYKQIKKTAINEGAIGCSISGSGPSIFSLCENKVYSDKVIL